MTTPLALIFGGIGWIELVAIAILLLGMLSVIFLVVYLAVRLARQRK